MTFVASLLLLTLPQVFPGGDLKLPPRSQSPNQVAAVRPLSEVERFRRDLTEMQGPTVKVELKLQEMAGAYASQAMETLILEVARSARANEMANLMVVARRFGTAAQAPRVADELLFQLLARPLAEATRPVVETMAALKGEAAKAALRECIRGRIPAVRRHAVEVVVPLLAADDVPWALELSREQSLDLQLRAIELLGALPDERGVQRLIELLAKDPVVAGASCVALAAMGPPSVPALQAFVGQPPIDRSFAYAAFALAGIAERSGPALLPDSLAAPLLKRLADPDALTRCLAAIPLADLTWRGASGTSGSDSTIVESLLAVVEPAQSLPNLDLLSRPARERLLRLTGRIVTADGLSWHAWWKEQKDGFTAVRARIEVTEQAAAMAVVTWRHEQRHVRLLAEGLADIAPVAGAVEVLLTRTAMRDLVAALQAAGFSDEVAMRVDSALPRLRCLGVQLPGGRAQVAMPLTQHERFDALVTLVQARLDEEVWQLYRDVATEERGAFWRAEQNWRAANPGSLDRARRFATRAIARWPLLSPMLRARAIEHLAALPERRQILNAADGETIVATLRALPELTEIDLRLLELAAGVPGDVVWRAAVELATQKKGAGPLAVRAMFAVVGPDAVLAALHDGNPAVRRAAVEEIMVVRDHRAAGRLVELLADSDEDVVRVAAAACGHLQLGPAAKPLIDLIAAAETTPFVRRDCLRALGRVGGELAFPVLQRALLAKSQDDKDAAMRGLGELRDPRAAHVLADLLVVGHGKDLGTLARMHLQRQSGTFAIPALRSQLQIVQDRAIREQLVLLLGAWHDAGAVPELLDLLRNKQHEARVAALLEGTTGKSFAGAPDRIDLFEAWYREHKAEPQWQWLLAALRTAEVATELRPEHFVDSQALLPVAELARLLIEVQEPRLWALAGAVLRTVAHDDFGMVSLETPLAAREAIAARYRVLVETQRTAQGR